MILFELSFPVLTSEYRLYFNGEGVDNNNHSLSVKGNTVCSFCTYFNCFSAGKYRKYTIAENITLSLEFQGTADIYIKNKNGDIISSKRISSQYNVTHKINFSIKNASDGEVYYAEIYAKSDCIINSGRYETDITPKRDILLAASFCTYKREKYIIPNIERLKKFKKKYSLPLIIFVADNGDTLPQTLSDDDIHIISNPNCGGSGGFARGLLEATKAGCTHIIFLDDDITLDTNVVLKTFSFLNILREEYYESFIGGAMLPSEEQYIQYECGALWDGFYLTPLGHEKDMREKANVFANEELPIPDYQAWWYCCFPTSFGEKYGYPLPLFIKSDDVEYGVRCRRPIITMNGIAVWHDGFENKYVGHFEYYIKRNELINTALHNPKLGIITNIRKLLASISKLTLFQRYFLAEAVVRAYDDFLKGPDWLLSIDPAEYNISLSAQTKPQTDTSMIGNAKIIENPDPVSNLLYYITLGGNILPSKNQCVKLDLMDTDINKLYRARFAYHIKEDGSICFVTKRKKRKLLWVIFQTIRMLFKFIFKYRKIRKEYIQKQSMLMSREFWEIYFSRYDAK